MGRVLDMHAPDGACLHRDGVVHLNDGALAEQRFWLVEADKAIQATSLIADEVALE